MALPLPKRTQSAGQPIAAPREHVLREVMHRREALRLWCGPVLVLLVTLSSRLFGQQPQVVDREPEIKAAYLYNFGRYVEWPPGPADRDFIIGVLGDSPVSAQLNKIARTKKLGARTIVVSNFRSEKDFGPCHMLFVPAGQDPQAVAAVLQATNKKAILVVGEETDFAEKRGHVGFYIAENNVKFEINNKAAANAGLKISSKLLNLGRIVGGKPGK